MKTRLGRRDVETFSLSFLDAICCGFGAVILLLVLTEVGEPIVFEQSREELEGRIVKLQEELEEIRGTTEVLVRELSASKGELDEEQLRIARLRGDLSALRGRYQSSKQESEIQNKLEGELVSAQQEVTAEMKRLLGSQYRRPSTDAIGGIPVDRSSRHGIVGQTAQELRDAMSRDEDFWLAAAPEGTRSLTPGWRSGAYQVAVQAQAPIALVGFDFGRRTVWVKDFVLPSGDAERDFACFAEVFKDMRGYRHELASPIQLRS